MSYFNGAKLRKLRESRGLSMDTVCALTGVTAPTISKIERGKIDPRISTVVRLLTAYDATLRDVESSTRDRVSLIELKEQAARVAGEIDRSGLGPSDPWARLDLKDAEGKDTRAEREVLGAST